MCRYASWMDFVDRCSREDLRSICAWIFRRQDYVVRLSSARKIAQGIDFVVEKPDRRCIVHCEHTASDVDIEHVWFFEGVIKGANAKHGYFITTGEFSPLAESWVRNKEITLWDRYDLKPWVLQSGIVDEREEQKACRLCGQANLLDAQFCQACGGQFY